MSKKKIRGKVGMVENKINIPKFMGWRKSNDQSTTTYSTNAKIRKKKNLTSIT